MIAALNGMTIFFGLIAIVVYLALIAIIVQAIIEDSKWVEQAAKDRARLTLYEPVKFLRKEERKQ